VLASAKFYAQLNYALANAGFAAWDTKSVLVLDIIPFPAPFAHLLLEALPLNSTPLI
jgi:hypothetical protein